MNQAQNPCLFSAGGFVECNLAGLFNVLTLILIKTQFILHILDRQMVIFRDNSTTKIRLQIKCLSVSFKQF